MRSRALLLAPVTISLLTMAVTGCANHHSVAVTAPAGASAMSLQLGTDGDKSAPTQVTYTCPGSGAGSVCGPEVVNGRWAKTLSVPVGTEVWIHAVPGKQDSAAATPNCWITDETGGTNYANGSGSCVVQVKPAG